VLNLYCNIQKEYFSSSPSNLSINCYKPVLKFSSFNIDIVTYVWVFSHLLALLGHICMSLSFILVLCILFMCCFQANSISFKKIIWLTPKHLTIQKVIGVKISRSFDITNRPGTLSSHVKFFYTCLQYLSGTPWKLEYLCVCVCVCVRMSVC